MHVKPRIVLLLLFIFFGGRILSAQPVISYLIPDIGSPGMNTYMEIIAPHDSIANFGADGLYLGNSGDNLRIVCENLRRTHTEFSAAENRFLLARFFFSF